MTLAELRQEVISRGYDYILPSRIDRFLQDAYGKICSRRSWPFLEETLVDEAPVEIADVGRVLSVEDLDNKTLMPGVTRRWILQFYTDLTQEATPQFWYLEDDTLKTFPVGSDSLSIHYLKRPAVLAESDEPLIPSEWQYLLVDLAVVACLKDDDEYEQARALRADVRDGMREMGSALLNRDLQNSRTIMRTGHAGDYLG